MNTETTCTHLLWIGDRWLEAKKHGDAWIFKNGRDAAAWLAYGCEDAASDERAVASDSR